MIRIIPAIDIINGQCVRLTQGDYKQLRVYHDDAKEMAQRFKDAGIEHTHVVDLDGAKSKHVVNLDTLSSITSTGISVDFGGGIKTEQDIELAFTHGASQVTIGSIAVKEPALFLGWLQKYGPEKIILGADFKGGYISVNGWLEDSKEELIPFLQKYADAGVQYVLCTDISKDGMMQGPAIEMYKQIMKELPQIKLIASGGVHSMQDIEELNAAGIYAVVTGKAIYEGSISLEQITNYIKSEK